MADIIDLADRRPKPADTESGYAEERVHGQVGALQVVSVISQESPDVWATQFLIRGKGIGDRRVVRLTIAAEQSATIDKDAENVAEMLVDTLRIARTFNDLLLAGED